MTITGSVDKHHVAVLAFPYGSHAGPLLNMVRRIAADAPEVAFSFFSTKKSNASTFEGLNEEQLHNIKPYDVEEGLPENFVPSHPFEIISYFVMAMPANYKTVMEEAMEKTGRKFTCLITDAFFWFGADMAQEMDAKWVPLWTAGPHPLLAHISTNLIREKLGTDEAGEREIDYLPGFTGLKVSDLPDEIIKDIESPFSAMIYKMEHALPRATAVAINSFAAVYPPIISGLETKLQMLLNVGPFILTTPQPISPDKYGCLQWLNTQKDCSVVYISFGSVVMPPPPELTAIAEALVEGGYSFIWAFRGNPEKDLPEGFLERTKTKGMVVGWAPQMQILKHQAVGVCMTHGGWNSILDCIVGGVPMISRPFFGDQGLNTATMEHMWGIGVGVENGVFTKEGTLRILETTMSSEKGVAMRQKMVELKDSALEAAGPEGDSTKSFDILLDICTTSHSDDQLQPHHGFRYKLRNRIADALAAASAKFHRRQDQHP